MKSLFFSESNGEMVSETLIAFDFGTKRIGVAVGNTLLRQAQPLKVISAESNVVRFNAIQQILDEWQVKQCIVGLPTHPDGAEHAMTARCRRFANQLIGRFGVTVRFVDERYTSAVIAAGENDIIDAEAAALILQQFFNENP